MKPTKTAICLLILESLLRHGTFKKDGAEETSALSRLTFARYLKEIKDYLRPSGREIRYSRKKGHYYLTPTSSSDRPDNS